MKHTQGSLSRLLVLSLMFILAACTQASPSHTATTVTITSSLPTATLSPTPTALPSPVDTTPPPPGAAPNNCPPSQPAQTISPDLAPVVGKAPVRATLPALIPLRVGYTQYGWLWKLIWEVGPSFTHPVTLHGTNVRTSASLLFQISQDPLTTSPVLDPSYPGHLHATFGDDWAECGLYAFLTGAGCYSMEAMWPGGHWLVYFAAGN